MLIKDDTISFDYDGTIDHHFGNGDKNPFIKDIRDFIFRLIRRGYNIHIITRRYGPENSNMGLSNEHLKVWKTADELGIPRENIIFTNREWKYSFIESIGACMHIDDDEREKYWIERHLPEVKMIWLGQNNWQNDIISKIESHNAFDIWIDKGLIKLGIVLAIILLTILFLS